MNDAREMKRLAAKLTQKYNKSPIQFGRSVYSIGLYFCRR
jgi:hypothetical protein